MERLKEDLCNTSLPHDALVHSIRELQDFLDELNSYDPKNP